MIFSCLPSFAADWNPVDPAILALKQSKTDPNADVEGLFREVHVGSEILGSGVKNLYTEYVRLKVFTERGKEHANVQIPYFGATSVYNIQGRTIHADGSVVELEKDAIFDKVLEKRGFKTKMVTFTMPAVEPGSIIEYRFSKTEGDDRHYYGWRELEVQTSFPVDEVNFFIKPLPSGRFPMMRYLPFGCNPEKGELTREGYELLKVRNVAAFHEEPDSPPEYSAKAWILIYYEENNKSGKDKFWTDLGKERYHGYSEQIKVNGEIKDLAGQITAGAKSDDEKLQKLLDYCRTQIKDVSGDKITTAELDKAKVNRNTLDTIRRKEGTHGDIQLAFLALAQGAGFEARRADLSDRSTFLFGPAMQSAYFLNAYDIAVYVGDKWKFFDVANTALPAGQLRWQEQAVYALITDPKQPEMVVTPMLTAEQNVRNRYANLKLTDDGTIEGDVREMLFGNDAVVWREANLHTNDTQREDAIREELKHRFADFEISRVKITSNPDATKPIGFTYHVLIRNYAQRTGKRLFVQPNLFVAGYASRFPEAVRHNSVYFEYPWSEVDAVDLKVPAGFELDHGDAPPGINIPTTCRFDIKIGYDKQKGQIQYRRQLVFGNKDLLFFETKTYPALKKVFDLMHESDNHMLTFKTEGMTASAGH